MPQQSRPKHPTIYPTVQDWYTNTGGVRYVAHAITAGTPPVARQLRTPQTGGAPGASPASHPDQVYWSTSQYLDAAIQNTITQAGGVAAILRIEIDCSLMPCSTQNTSCLYQVPRLINRYGFTNVPLRIYSHRDEAMGGGNASSKRVIICRSGDNNTALLAAYNANTDWSWAPWNTAAPAYL